MPGVSEARYAAVAKAFRCRPLDRTGDNTSGQLPRYDDGLARIPRVAPIGMPFGLKVDRQCHPQALTGCRDTTLRAQLGPRLGCLNDGSAGESSLSASNYRPWSKFSGNTFLRRPGERRDPYAVTSRLGDDAETFCNNERPGLWVPAFAGTTGR